jgi:hypothetical protein
VRTTNSKETPQRDFHADPDSENLFFDDLKCTTSKSIFPGNKQALDMDNIRMNQGGLPQQAKCVTP